jgi:translocation and assembly module TamA
VFDGVSKADVTGATVAINGVPVGTVTDLGVVLDPQDLSSRTPVVVEIRRDRLRVKGGESAMPEKGTALKPMVEEKGLRAQLLDALRRRPPAAVVVFVPGWPGGGYERIAGFPELERWLRYAGRIGTVGGRYYAVTSVEVTRWIGENWGIATFVDAGNATDSLSHFHLAPGYGVGGRLRTPIGPFRIDVAYGQDAKSARVHFSVGLSF